MYTLAKYIVIYVVVKQKWKEWNLEQYLLYSVYGKLSSSAHWDKLSMPLAAKNGHIDEAKLRKSNARFPDSSGRSQNRSLRAVAGFRKRHWIFSSLSRQYVNLYSVGYLYSLGHPVINICCGA